MNGVLSSGFLHSQSLKPAKNIKKPSQACFYFHSHSPTHVVHDHENYVRRPLGLDGGGLEVGVGAISPVSKSGTKKSDPIQKCNKFATSLC